MGVGLLVELVVQLAELALWVGVFCFGGWLVGRMRSSSEGLRTRYGYLGRLATWLGVAAGGSLWLFSVLAAWPALEDVFYVLEPLF